MAGHTVSYTYNNPTCSGGTCSYMTSITTPKGTTTITYTTSFEGFALKSITDPLGNVKNYGTYISDNVVRVIDANGNPIFYQNNFSGYTEKITDALGNAVTYGYDTRGNRTSITDAKGNISRLTYDTRGNVTSVTNPLGNKIQFVYDTNDNRTSSLDPAGNTTRYEYDAKGNLINTTDAHGKMTIFTYNSSGEMITMKDAKDHSTVFAYDSLGNVTSVTNPITGRDSYTYDTVGRVISHTDPKGNTKRYEYDGLDRLTRVTYPNASTTTYTYDCCSQKTVTDPNGTLTFADDSLNRLTSFKDVYGKTISYGYDKAGNLTGLTYPDGKVVRYTYDTAGRLIRVTDWLNKVTIYGYDSVGNLVRGTYPDGSSVTHQYDSANRLKSTADYNTTDATVNALFNYTRDALGNSKTASFYQPLNVVPPPQSVSYAYDADNRILTAGSTTFNFDGNGNLIKKTQGSAVTNYSWNYDDMLTQIGTGGHTYRYDGLDNRRAKIVNAVETRYVVDPGGSLSQVLAETNASGVITAYYVYGLGLISKITPAGQAYYYHYDGIGSTIGITDASGNIVNKYAYDAFGKVLSQTETIPNPFKYVGRFGVMDEGNGLLYMRARYYDPQVGRFINKDPIGLAGGLNMYAYVGNDPINLLDPTGLQSDEARVTQGQFWVSAGMIGVGATIGITTGWTGFGTVAAVALVGAGTANLAGGAIGFCLVNYYDKAIKRDQQGIELWGKATSTAVDAFGYTSPKGAMRKFVTEFIKKVSSLFNR
jgi:RHS repeat-associated protein